jgi:hypothetical protein
MMKPEDLRRFAERPWGEISDSKLRFLAERFERDGPAGALKVAQRLAARWRRLHPEGASRESRERDLEAHIALKSRLDRAHLGLRRR